MKIMILTTILVLMMAIPSFGATMRCEVVSMDSLVGVPKDTATYIMGDTKTLTIKCEGRGKFDDVEIGDKVKIRLPKSKQSVEGC